MDARIARFRALLGCYSNVTCVVVPGNHDVKLDQYDARLAPPLPDWWTKNFGSHIEMDRHPLLGNELYLAHYPAYARAAAQKGNHSLYLAGHEHRFSFNSSLPLMILPSLSPLQAWKDGQGAGLVVMIPHGVHRTFVYVGVTRWQVTCVWLGELALVLVPLFIYPKEWLCVMPVMVVLGYAFLH